MNRAVFLDRDGVINKSTAGEFIKDRRVKKWDEFEFLPNTIKALKGLSKTDYKIIIVTNQSGISKGLHTEEALIDIHNKMIEELSRHGARIDSVKFCPHKEEDGCRCRKPETFMIISAKNEFDLDLNKSWFIGDTSRDIKTAEKVKELGYNFKSILVMTGYGGKDGDFDAKPDYHAADLLEAVNIILKG